MDCVLTAAEWHRVRRSTTFVGYLRKVMLVNSRKFGLATVILVLLTACAVVTGPQRIDANQEKNLKSLPNETKAQIKFVNKSGQEVKVYWLDFSGHRVLYKVLEAGESYDQQTYLTHPWLVTDGRDDAWNIFFADAQPRVIYIVPPGAKGSQASREVQPAQSAEECKAAGGIWGSLEMPGSPWYKPSCLIPAQDADKRCQSSKDCLSNSCVISAIEEPSERTSGVYGACAAFGGTFGCVTRVEGGVRQPTVCAH
jgi:hypothetical protein